MSRAKPDTAPHQTLIRAEDGALAGRPVFIIGGGPSLAGVNLKLLEDLKLPRIAVNMGFLKGADAVLFGDSRVRTELIAKDARLLEAWTAFSGPKLLARFEQEGVKQEEVPDMRMIPSIQGWGKTLAEGLVNCDPQLKGANTGLAAVNLADILGASDIFLLGFDMHPTEGMTTNWHDLYPKEWKTHAPSIYNPMLLNFARWAPSIRARVWNCNPESALRCFPFMDFQDAALAAFSQKA